MVPGLVGVLFISKRDKPHRTHDWFDPFGARRQLDPLLLLLPRLEAQQHLARQHLQHLRLPCREDSVIPSTLAGSAKRSLLPFSIFSFSFLLPQTLASAMVWWLRRLRAAGLFHPLAVEFFEIQKKACYIIFIPQENASLHRSWWGGVMRMHHRHCQRGRSINRRISPAPVQGCFLGNSCHNP